MQFTSIIAFPGEARPAAAVAALTDPILRDPRFGKIRLRPGRVAFWKAVLGRHGIRCEIIGCVEPALLDVAHLPGRDWKLGHNTAADGIPLRADMRRALDAGLTAGYAPTHVIIYVVYPGSQGRLPSTGAQSLATFRHKHSRNRKNRVRSNRHNRWGIN